MANRITFKSSINAILGGLFLMVGYAQTPSPTPVTTQSTAEQAPDPLKRELTKKQKKQRARELSKESAYDLDERIPYIVTPEERAAFMKLSNDEEREQFIED